MMINHKVTRMVEIEEDEDGLRTVNASHFQFRERKLYLRKDNLTW